MLISALNALTLSPALCAVLLRRGDANRGFMRYVLGAISSRPRARGYVAVVRRLAGVAIAALVAVALVVVASVLLFGRTPSKLFTG